MSALSDLKRGRTLRGDQSGLGIDFSEHAVTRFAERLQRPLEEAELRRQLSCLLASARVVRRRPEWIRSVQANHPRAEGWLIVGDDLAMPLVAGKLPGELVAVTAVVPQGLAKLTRESRNRRHAKHREWKRAKRHVEGIDRGRPMAGPDADEWADE